MIMSLYSISGVGCNCGGCAGCSGIGGRAKRRARRAKRKERRTRLYCKGRRVKAVALSPARNAFLALIRINVKKMAVKLYDSLQNPDKKARLFQKWCKLGGNAKKLESAILKAYAKFKRKRGVGAVGYMDIDGIGGIGSVSALLATALPIIQALKEFLGGGGGDEQESEQESEPQQVESETLNIKETETDSMGAITINPYIIGGGLLLAYLIFKKKRK